MLRLAAVLATWLLLLPWNAFAVDDMTLLQAAAINDVAAVQSLIAQDADLEARDSDGRTALLLATRANAIVAAKALIDAGADVNAKDDIKDTPYLFAGAEGRLEILRMTLAAGADLKDTNRYGGTALIPAAEKGYPDNVRALLKAGVAVDHVNDLGWTALLEAIVLSDGGTVHQEIVRDLIAGGANVNIADSDGVSPLTHAKARGYGEIAALLEAAGAH
ncbi:MAG TPA: ankyrin repeat domain-containing protein [Devosiaceae bacterium]|jgi:hypothetical protein